jgi:heat shock protein HslJ/membrane-bound inhibitor of C-type lysozyme
MFRAGFAVLMSAGAVLMLAGCAGGAGGSPSDVSTLQCGDQRVALGMLGDTPQLTVGEARFALRPVEAASGAKYEALGDPSTTFWSRGDRAMLAVKGQGYPECLRVDATAPASRASGKDPAVMLQGGEWGVEDINGAGIVDRSRATLNFGADGNLSGRGSCNLYSGRYTLTGEGLTVSSPASTMMACEPVLMQQESQFHQILSQVRRFRFGPDGALILETGDGRTITARRN